jgi:UDP-glucuronate decarboxylase
MKILVTGGAGFLGSHLCRFLLNKNGDEVVCLDNFFTGKRKNIKDLIDHPKFKVIPHDIINPLSNIRFEGSFDQIYNLACPASPIHYQFDPIETIKANTIGVINVLEFAKTNGANVLQASTSEVYGDPLEHPQKESYKGNVNILGPRSCYDVGKMIAESLFMNYHRKYKLPIRIARIFNTYGPNMDINDGRVVSNFIVQALENKPITIYGDGNQTRSFCYVDDLIDGLYRLGDSDFIGPVNLGNPGEFTMNELAGKVVNITNSGSQLAYKELPADDPVKRKPDINVAMEKLNWRPEISLDEGLVKTVEYFRGVLRR